MEGEQEALPFTAAGNNIHVWLICLLLQIPVASVLLAWPPTVMDTGPVSNQHGGCNLGSGDLDHFLTACNG